MVNAKMSRAVQVDMTKVKMDVIRPWIATRATELLGFEDEVLINFVYGLLDVKLVDGKKIQIQLTGFMEKNTSKFMKELWNLLLSAQNNVSGVPQQFLDAKEEEQRKMKEENDKISQEIQKRKERGGRDLEREKLARMSRWRRRRQGPGNPTKWKKQEMRGDNEQSGVGEKPRGENTFRRRQRVLRAAATAARRLCRGTNYVSKHSRRRREFRSGELRRKSRPQHGPASVDFRKPESSRSLQRDRLHSSKNAPPMPADGLRSFLAVQEQR
ncbi:hypothetical protein KSP40_PGU017668 [Platanthera guangdongensis]|uniref:PWI domain-containing protein n=1 Tax=Platanthera guangdongensis TaxID=2320717 RepID=A0ABR2M9K0_9ASPA